MYGTGVLPVSNLPCPIRCVSSRLAATILLGGAASNEGGPTPAQTQVSQLSDRVYGIRNTRECAQAAPHCMQARLCVNLVQASAGKRHVHQWMLPCCMLYQHMMPDWLACTMLAVGICGSKGKTTDAQPAARTEPQVNASICSGCTFTLPA